MKLSKYLNKTFVTIVRLATMITEDVINNIGLCEQLILFSENILNYRIQLIVIII